MVPRHALADKQKNVQKDAPLNEALSALPAADGGTH
jgi:hypothetical protein